MLVSAGVPVSPFIHLPSIPLHSAIYLQHPPKPSGFLGKGTSLARIMPISGLSKNSWTFESKTTSSKPPSAAWRGEARRGDQDRWRPIRLSPGPIPFSNGRDGMPMGWWKEGKDHIQEIAWKKCLRPRIPISIPNWPEPNLRMLPPRPHPSMSFFPKERGGPNHDPPKDRVQHTFLLYVARVRRCSTPSATPRSPGAAVDRPSRASGCSWPRVGPQTRSLPQQSPPSVSGRFKGRAETSQGVDDTGHRRVTPGSFQEGTPQK